MYNNRILEIFQNPTNAGGLQGANGVGKYVDEACGDSIKIYLKIEDDTIQEARFKALGNVGTIVAGSCMCTCLLDCSLEEALKIDEQRIFEICGEFPEDKKFTINFAINAVSLAIDDYYAKMAKEAKNGAKKVKEIKEKAIKAPKTEIKEEVKENKDEKIEEQEEKPVKKTIVKVGQDEKVEEDEVVEGKSILDSIDDKELDNLIKESQEKAKYLAEISMKHFDSLHNVNIFASEENSTKAEQKIEETGEKKTSKAKANFDALFED